VAERAIALGMTVLAYDPFIATDTAMDGKVRMVRPFTDLLPQVDVVSFHVPLTDETRGLLNSQTFKLCRKGVLVVNAARGGVVDEEALVEAIDSGICGGAALDVYTTEPPPADSPLRRHPRILCTPHLGASTEEAQQAVSVDAAAACLAYLRGEGIRGAVNAGGVRVDLDPTQRAFVDLAARMAELISPMITRGIASVTIEVAGTQLSPAAGTIERTALVGLLKSHLDTPLNVINIGHIAQQRGIRTRTVTVEQEAVEVPQLTIEVQGPPGAVDASTPAADRTRRIVGRVYDDHKPRVVEINGYRMDMVPAGSMLLVQNEDRPGMIGLVGNVMGEAQVNIADMSISRRPTDGKHTALMVLKLDAEASDAVLEQLKARPGIIKVAKVMLPPEPNGD
ncbi:MAG TPA: NAD(P)-dependent oxidoreductase, partial [Phycisphaeraceae bacterium]